MKKVFPNIIAFILLFSFASSCSSSDKKDSDGWTEADGVGQIIDNQVALARDEAIVDAKKRAVEQELGSIVRSQSKVIDGEFDSSRLTSRSDGFIEDYRVIDEKSDAPLYRVKIRAKVNRVSLEKAISEIVADQGYPRIMLIAGDEAASSAARSIFESELGKKGYLFVDEATTKGILSRSGKLSLEAGSSVLRTASGEAGAEVVMLLELSQEEKEIKAVNTNMKSYQSVLQVRAVDAYSAQVLASHTQSAAKAHISAEQGKAESARAAAKMSIEPVSTQILQKWKKGTTKEVRLTIEGLDYAGGREFIDFVSGLRGVEQVNRVSQNESTLVVRVMGEKNGFDIVDMITHSSRYSKFQVKEVNSGQASLKAP